MTARMQQSGAHEFVREVFRAFDLSTHGFISLQDFLRVVSKVRDMQGFSSL